MPSQLYIGVDDVTYDNKHYLMGIDNDVCFQSENNDDEAYIECHTDDV